MAIRTHGVGLKATFIKIFNRYGNRLLFLPHYSLDINPIEKKWA